MTLAIDPIKPEPADPELFDERREQRLINEIMELLVTHHGGSFSEEALDHLIDDLQRALHTAREAHRHQVRKSGEPYFFHPLRVAHLAARHWMDFASVMAALLHDVVEDTPTSIETIRNEFGDEVSLLVDGLTKVDDKLLSRELLKAQTYRKQLLLAVRDIRVLCLKFWDRINKAKFNAYFALASSSCLPVSEPYFCVVPYLEITRTELVDYIEETPAGQDDVVSEKNCSITFNLWDGQGLISPRLAKLWSAELGLDYIPSAFIIRANFIKGMLCVFDFNHFSEEVAFNQYITDIWGKKVIIRDMDIILTQSQFKLWNAYSSQQEYIDNCRKNGLAWGISRVTPKFENKSTFLNYQFVQSLNLSKSQIHTLCHKTLSYFDQIVRGKVEYTFIVSFGEDDSREGHREDIF